MGRDSDGSQLLGLYSQCIYRKTRASVSLAPINGDTALSKAHEHMRDNEPHVDVISFP